MTGIAACCARAASGQDTAAPPSSAMNARRFTAVSPVLRTKDSTAMLRCGISIWLMSAVGQKRHMGRLAVGAECPLLLQKRRSKFGLALRALALARGCSDLRCTPSSMGLPFKS